MLTKQYTKPEVEIIKDLAQRITDNGYEFIVKQYNAGKREGDELIVKDGKNDVASIRLHSTVRTYHYDPKTVISSIRPVSEEALSTEDKRHLLAIKGIAKETTDAYKTPVYETRIKALAEDIWNKYEQGFKDAYMKHGEDSDALDEIRKTATGASRRHYEEFTHLESNAIDFMKEANNPESAFSIDDQTLSGIHGFMRDWRKGTQEYAARIADNYIEDILVNRFRDAELKWGKEYEANKPSDPGM